MTDAWKRYHFNPRSPHGERRIAGLLHLSGHAHFNPRSPHGERRNTCRRLSSVKGISTHAPRTGSDALFDTPPTFTPISTHAPRTGSDCIRNHIASYHDISTHAPRTGSDDSFHLGFTAQGISTHAPRTGSDRQTIANESEIIQFQPTLPARGATEAAKKKLAECQAFQPTLPARGATMAECQALVNQTISTHAPRTGSDTT